jgi:diaminohydroxyphosphoribosylaminopyrimidine deaminase/5-amino-6-(5-phosphoribosylamino)uracil reductase
VHSRTPKFFRGIFVRESLDITFMRRALDLARRGEGATSPNPMVGAVVAKHGRIIGEGYHKRAGSPHAEVLALSAAGSAAKSATLYVTLEPCCHFGRTGPCVDVIAQAGIRKVVYAQKDPDPRVNGKGLSALRKYGVSVSGGVLEDEARQLNEAHYCFHTKGRPMVMLKLAQTLDGRIATASGDSRWISGPESRQFVHQLRAKCDAVVVGMGTVRADNPSLTVRLAKGPNPYRVVLSRSLKFPRPCALLDDNADMRTILAAPQQSIERFTRSKHRNNLTFWQIKTARNGLLDLVDFVRRAGEFGIRSLLVEGGARLATSFFKSGLVDKYIAITAPRIIGQGISAIGDLNIARLSDAVALERVEWMPRGQDCIFVGYPKEVR